MRSLGVALVLLSLVGCEDEPEPATAPPRTYVTMSDAELAAALDTARASARENDRRVLLDFGADWCPDCREVLRLAHEPTVASLLAEDYETVVIDVGRFDQHTELLQRYGIERIATLVVLEPSGQKVAQTTLEPITGAAEGLTGEVLAGWLRNPTENWQPE